MGGVNLSQSYLNGKNKAIVNLEGKSPEDSKEKPFEAQVLIPKGQQGSHSDKGTSTSHPSQSLVTYEQAVYLEVNKGHTEILGIVEQGTFLHYEFQIHGSQNSSASLGERIRGLPVCSLKGSSPSGVVGAGLPSQTQSPILNRTIKTTNNIKKQRNAVYSMWLIGKESPVSPDYFQGPDMNFTITEVDDKRYT